MSINRDRVNATTEEDIERQAIEDGTNDLDWSNAISMRPSSFYRGSRERLGGLSQTQFAAAPQGPAEVLLQVIEREPEAIARAFARRDVT